LLPDVLKFLQPNLAAADCAVGAGGIGLGAQYGKYEDFAVFMSAHPNTTSTNSTICGTRVRL